MIHMGTIVPHDVSTYVNFDRSNPDWCYHPKASSMFDKQAEGVAHVWNVLSDKKVAVLADEVGMGKTLQALGVCALLWRIKNDARILVIEPREIEAANWQNEFLTCLSNDYIKSDDIIKSTDEERPSHEYIQ